MFFDQIMSPLILRAGFVPLEIKISEALYFTAVRKILSSWYILVFIFCAGSAPLGGVRVYSSVNYTIKRGEGASPLG